jgi:ribosomal protein S18 acetylase RimI-like enzyme
MREQVADQTKIITQSNMIDSAVKRPGQPHHEIRARASIYWPLSLALDQDEQIVGMAAYSFLWPAAGTTHSLFLTELFVCQSARRQGVGTRLMDELRAIAAARPSCTRMEWMADRSNPIALSFYRRQGYAEQNGKVCYRLEGA